jgi:hypothetical protein
LIVSKLSNDSYLNHIVMNSDPTEADLTVMNSDPTEADLIEKENHSGILYVNQRNQLTFGKLIQLLTMVPQDWEIYLSEPHRYCFSDLAFTNNKPYLDTTYTVGEFIKRQKHDILVPGRRYEGYQADHNASENSLIWIADFNQTGYKLIGLVRDNVNKVIYPEVYIKTPVYPELDDDEDLIRDL